MAAKKRLYPVALSVLLPAIAVMSACSSSNGTQKSTDGGAASDKGREPRTITVMRSDSSIQPVLKDSPALKQILAKTNFKVNMEGVPSSDYEAKKKTLIATNNIPDVIHVTRTDITTYASTGIFLNLTPYLDKYAPNLKKRLEGDPEANKLKIDGNFYGFPIMANKAVAANVGNFPMIRADILQELNLKAPTTFEELYEVLKAVKKAYPDSYPWTMRSGSQYNLRFLAYAFGSGFSIYYEPKQDKFIYGPTRPEFKEVITYLAKLYKEKLLDPNFTNLTAQQWQQNLSSGKSLFFYDNYTFAVNFNAALQQVNPKAKFDMLPIFKDAAGNKRNYMDNPSSFNSYAISSKVKNPEEIVKMFDWMYSDEGADITNFGVPGEHFTRSGDKVTISKGLIDQFKDKQDPYRAMQSFLGTGLLAFSTFTDDTPMLTISPPELKQWSDTVKQQKDRKEVVEKPLDPPFNEEEREKLKQLNSKVDTVVTQNIDKFILGSRPLSELDAFAKEVAASGATEIEDIYNAAWKRMK
ncbi:extracellular solute-binding protein [Paenibacillus mesophilus]|uniref:extracellular solute-binding protein n=1 Tax=Paenibacillus mesophilus TaxID=2582849 RepID=UPI00110EF5CD|nr:extracellular solute-binding protein [Paenibacillus mesophilus]TMV48148.1 extracellular solute-binding protein [Paenibacillus mesophilus]